MKSRLVNYLDRGFQFALLLLAVSAPLSIAATQIAWSLALLIWLIRAFLVRTKFDRRPIDLAVLAFVGLTIVSSIFSYEPRSSIGKLAAVSLVTLAYLVSGNIRTTSMLRKVLATLLISSCFTAVFAIGNFIVGRNLKVTKLTSESPLRSAGVQENDTILRVNGISVSNPDNLTAAAVQTSDGTIRLEIYRVENIIRFEFPLAALSDGDRSTNLGVLEWSRGRDVRAAGFYGHYTTFAEALQLVMSLAFGLLIALPGGLFSTKRLLLGAAVAAFCGALILTVTRASWAGFAVSAAMMVLVGTSRRTVLICAALAVPLAIGGLFYLQQKRNVAFIDTNDSSTTWRLTVWREGFDLFTASPRHLAVGVGMDSIKTHAAEWHLFDNGNLPMGHMHSTPLEFAVERGAPTLIAWIVWMFLYLQMLRRGFRKPNLGWPERGLLLGALGGTAGFLSSGLVHYNWGDSEVVMIFYIIMGLSFATLRLAEEVLNSSEGNTSQDSRKAW